MGLVPGSGALLAMSTGWPCGLSLPKGTFSSGRRCPAASLRRCRLAPDGANGRSGPGLGGGHRTGPGLSAGGTVAFSHDEHPVHLLQVEHTGSAGVNPHLDAPCGDGADHRDLHAEPVAAETAARLPLESLPQMERLHARPCLSAGRRFAICAVHSRPPPAGLSHAWVGARSE